MNKVFRELNILVPRRLFLNGSRILTMQSMIIYAITTSLHKNNSIMITIYLEGF